MRSDGDLASFSQSCSLIECSKVFCYSYVVLRTAWRCYDLLPITARLLTVFWLRSSVIFFCPLSFNVLNWLLTEIFCYILLSYVFYCLDLTRTNSLPGQNCLWTVFGLTRPDVSHLMELTYPHTSLTWARSLPRQNCLWTVFGLSFGKASLSETVLYWKKTHVSLITARYCNSMNGPRDATQLESCLDQYRLL